jgi:hypothetical protein
LPRSRRTGTACQDPERRLQLGRQLLDGQHVGPGRGELDRERHALQPADHSGHLLDLLPRRVAARRRPIDEQPDRRRRVGLLLQLRQGQRRYDVHALAGHAEQLAARREDRQVPAGFQKPAADGGRVGDDVLAVVQDQQEFAGPDQLDDLVDQPYAVERVHPDRGGDGRRHCGRIGDRCQRRPAHPVVELVPDPTGQCERELGLADPTRTRQREQPGGPLTDQATGLGQIGGPADQLVRRDRRWPQRRAGAVALAPGGGPELGQAGRVELESVSEQPQGVRPGRAATTSFEGRDRVDAQPRELGQPFLRQSGLSPVPAQQITETRGSHVVRATARPVRRHRTAPPSLRPVHGGCRAPPENSRNSTGLSPAAPGSRRTLRYPPVHAAV